MLLLHRGDQPRARKFRVVPIPSWERRCPMLRRSLGFVLTVICVLFAGYQLAWHWREIDKLGGLSGLLGAVGLVAFGLLAVFWRDAWGSSGRRWVTALALVSFLFGGGFIRNALREAPFVTLAWIVGIAVVLGVLYALTVVDTTPAWVNRLRTRLAPATP